MPSAFQTSTLVQTLLCCTLIAPVSSAQSESRLPAPENLSIRNEVEHAIDRGVAWLVKNQHPDGHWSTADHPAVSALAVIALQGQPNRLNDPGEQKAAEKAYRYILESTHPDGSIHRGKALVNYNTALSTLALVASNNPEYKPVVAKAREFLISMQIDLGDQGKLDTPFDGGVGYGSKYKHSDMSNTLAALEALYHSKRYLSDETLADAKDLNWAAAVHFIQSCQNLPEYNKQPWVADDPQNRGGFVYYPGRSMAGETNLPSGRVALRSYGSISYAGLLSYIYAQMDKEDPRVLAVLDWLRSHFTLEENPGMGPQGLYFYYHTMAKALSLYGLDELELKSGKEIDWRKELALKLINLQQPDGSWVNDNGRWWEKDPALVTSYSLIALEMIHRGW